MTPNPIFRPGLLLLSLLLPLSPLKAAEPDLRELLRDALYTEEVTRDPEAAAKRYEELLSKHDSQGAFAASALFRLAEVRRKQDRKDEAIALYQRLIREFPKAEVEAKLARENLVTLGAKTEDPVSPAADEEAIELKRLQQWVESSPDRLRDPELALDAVKKGQLRPIEFLLKAGAFAEPWKLLREAVTTGNLRTTTLLLDYPFKSGYRGVDDALFTAVTLEYHDVARLLLSRGADPNRQDWYLMDESVPPRSLNKAQMTALHVAVRKRNVALCKLLLEHKADPNRFAEKPELPANDSRLPGPPTGTPLHDAVVSSLEITRLLIEHGANINAAAESTGFTPLHSAARASEPAETIQLLIEKGASLDASTTGSPQVRQPGISNSRTILPGTTPLRLALEWRELPVARQLLKAGASAKHPGILVAAINSFDPDLVGQVLAKGALEAEPDSDPIRILASRGLVASVTGGWEKIVELLVQHGAKPHPAWIDQQFEGASLYSLPLLYRHFLVPRLLEKPAISVITPSLGNLEPIELASGTAAEAPPSLVTLLLQSQVRWPSVFLGSQNHFPTLLTRWRKNADGAPEALRATLDGPDPLPDLQWGDVLELAPDWEKLGGQPDSFNVSSLDELPTQLAWPLRKRISLPVTVEIDGKSREITLRGDRLIFDPGSNEVPLVGAAQLMSLLWQPPSDPGEPKVTLARQGWSEVPIPWGRTGKSDFPLEAGDKLLLTAPAAPAEAEAGRRQHLRITSPGVPFTRRFGSYSPDLKDGSRQPLQTSLPTLIQTLADLTGYWSQSMQHAPNEPGEIAPWILWQQAIGSFLLQFLPHPDYSKIRIRRLNDDGSETVIPVDLAAAIAAAGPDATRDTAKQADVVLRFGDIVEVPQLPGQAGKPWQGPSAAEVAFFAKALDCRIQFTVGEKPLELREIRYQGPRFVDVDGNWIPLWPTAGTPTLNAARALGDLQGNLEITRQGAQTPESGPSSWLYLRDNDLVRSESVSPQPGQPGQPPQQPQPRQPRPRVVPPPNR